MKFLFLLPGLVCLLMGYVFLQLFRNRLRKEEASARNYTAKARARLVGNGETHPIRPHGTVRELPSAAGPC